MKNILCIMLIAVISLLFIMQPLTAQDSETQPTRQADYKPFEEYTEEDGLNRLDQMALWEDDDNDIMALYDDLLGMSKVAARLNSTKMVGKIVSFPDYKNIYGQSPQSFHGIVITKIRAMQYLKDFPIAKEYVIKSLDHGTKGIQIAAATVLLSWDVEWDRAIAILLKYNTINEFKSFKNEKAIPYLKAIVANSDNGEEILAATILCDIYNDTTTLTNITLDVISNASKNYNKEIANRTSYALKVIPKTALLQALPDMVCLIDCGNRRIRDLVVEHLVYLSTVGYADTVNTLMDIRANNPEPCIREKGQDSLDVR